LKKKGIISSEEYVLKVVGLIKERANFVKDFWDQSDFFFESPKEYDRKMVKKRWKENTPKILNSVCKELEIITEFTSENLEVKIKEFLEKNELGMGQVMTALRLTIVGSGRGPGMFDIMELLGKEEVIRRIEVGMQKIRNLLR